MNKYIAVNYTLYSIENNEKNLEEQTSKEVPFVFISGMGITLESFEKQVEGLEKGAKFDFKLNAENAYGERFDERVLDLDKEMFSINGHFDHENIKIDAIVPLENEDGNTFYGRVLDITDDKVKMDLNHPLAGKDLNFVGEIIENREATNDEIQSLINSMTSSCGSSGCGCGSSDCECDNESCGSGCGCGCGCN